jgi:hypothetical protein
MEQLNITQTFLLGNCCKRLLDLANRVFSDSFPTAYTWAESARPAMI